MKKNITIIGAGLTGLTLAYLLKNKDYSIQVIDARDRIGGRIHTKISKNETPIEMGATWLGTQHEELLKLLKKLNLSVFEQFMEGITLFEPLSTAPPQQIHLPANQHPSYRIKGGSISLIDTLAKSLASDELILNEKITRISYTEDLFQINSVDKEYRSQKIITTIPPLLLVNSIQFNPPLPNELLEIANSIHTWMGDSIKFGISYKRPFWKENRYSGTVFSNVGPITELYDHSNYEESKFALKGFLQSGMHAQSKEDRKIKVRSQLEKFFGPIASEILEYEELIWRKEPYTFEDSEHFIFPHQNNGHPVFQQSFFDNNLFIAGTETATQYGGYMEGAVRSALSVYRKL